MILTGKWGFLFSGTGLGQDASDPPQPGTWWDFSSWFHHINGAPRTTTPASEPAAEPTDEPSTE